MLIFGFEVGFSYGQYFDNVAQVLSRGMRGTQSNVPLLPQTVFKVLVLLYLKDETNYSQLFNLMSLPLTGVFCDSFQNREPLDEECIFI